MGDYSKHNQVVFNLFQADFVYEKKLVITDGEYESLVKETKKKNSKEPSIEADELIQDNFMPKMPNPADY